VCPSRPLYNRVRVLPLIVAHDVPGILVKDNAKAHGDSLGPKFMKHIENAIAASVSSLLCSTLIQRDNQLRSDKPGKAWLYPGGLGEAQHQGKT
jgi:hypothetical protein